MSFIYPTVCFCCSNIFPEFLPVPDWKKRDRISEKLERKDMLRRRNVIDIPEFYVGKRWMLSCLFLSFSKDFCISCELVLYLYA